MISSNQALMWDFFGCLDFLDVVDFCGAVAQVTAPV
jgi:hypothetical protein